jgi:hypothetical protein
MCMMKNQKNIFLRIFPRYDMYAGESGINNIVASGPTDHADQEPNLEPDPASDFITLANGERIW